MEIGDLFTHRAHIWRVESIGGDRIVNWRYPLEECVRLPHKYHRGDLVLLAWGATVRVTNVFYDGNAGEYEFFYDFWHYANVAETDIVCQWCT